MKRKQTRARAASASGTFDNQWVALGLLAAITLLGLALRLIYVTEIPTGLHGDEAIVGLEGQRVLDEGYIGPYSQSALGQPTGPMYLAALTVKLFGNTVLGVRVLAVILGTLAIPALFFAVRWALGTPVALLSAGLLAVMGWHIHFSRIGFPLPAWPLLIILTVGVVAYAVKRGTSPWWIAAGIITGLGIYTYNAHPLALATIVAFVGLALLIWYRPISTSTLGAGAIFIAAMLVALLPMITFAIRNTDTYFSHFRHNSIREQEAWQELDGVSAKAGFVLEDYVGWWTRLSWDPTVDYIDATGVTETVPLLLLLVSLVGIVVGLARYRGPLVYLGVMLVTLLPFSTVLTLGGEMRRTFAMAPLLAMFAALAIYEGLRIARRSGKPNARWIGIAAIALVVGAGVGTDLHNYFVVHGQSDQQQWVFAAGIADASKHLRTLPDDRYVYFYADRWSFDYETRRFLAPNARGEDRSREFGQFSHEVDPASGTPVFVLIGTYQSELAEIQRRYPGGEVVFGGDSASPTFIAYELPPGPPRSTP